MRTTRTGAALLTAALLLGVTPSAMADVKSGHASAIDNHEGEKIKQYMSDHPGDLVGVDNLIQKFGGPALEVQINKDPRTYTAAEAKEELRRLEKLPITQASGDATTMDVPVDAFDVAFSFVPIGGFHTLATGTWNFRDNYIGTGSPDDIAAIHLDDNCVRAGETLSYAFRYDGTETEGSTYLKDSGVNTASPVVGVRDTTSGFGMNTDNGVVTTDVINYCGPVTWRGAFTFEHNQGGGEVLGVSAGFAFLNVSYGGTPLTLQKSTQIVEHTP